MVPLQGGVLLDTVRLDRTLWIERGRGRFEAGVRLEAADTAAQQIGWELRMFPRRGGRPRRRLRLRRPRRALARSATASARFRLRPGAEGRHLREAPRLIELRGSDIGKALHAYGTTGIGGRSRAAAGARLSLDRDGGRRLPTSPPRRASPRRSPSPTDIPEARQPDGMAAAALLPRARRGRPARKASTSS